MRETVVIPLPSPNGGVAGPDALSITLLDRTICYGGLVAIGVVVFTVNQIRAAWLQTAGVAIA